MKARNVLALSAISLGLLVFLLPVQRISAQGTLSITYYGDPDCDTCKHLKGIIEDFVASHPDVSATYVMENFYSNATRLNELKAYYAALGLTIIGIPVAVLNNSGKLETQYAENLNALSLESWYTGATQGPITLWESFLFGLAFGGSPCLLLVMGVLGTTLVAVESRKKYISISIGLILGLIAAYVVISLIFLAFLNFVGVFAYFRYIFGAVLLAIGIWQIVEFKKEKSTIFGTSDRVKTWLKTFIEKQSGPYAFLLGILFAFVKIPCVGGVYLQIMYNAWQNPLLIWFVVLYYSGMLLPIVILLVALRIGLQSNKINSFREKYRPYLRLISGIILIALTLYLLLL